MKQHGNYLKVLSKSQKRKSPHEQPQKKTHKRKGNNLINYLGRK